MCRGNVSCFARDPICADCPAVSRARPYCGGAEVLDLYYLTAETRRREANAEKYKRLTVAKGEGEAIETVFGAIHKGRPTNDLIAVKYLEALQKIADGQATKVFLPYEASGILGSIAGVGELFKEKLSAEKIEEKQT